MIAYMKCKCKSKDRLLVKKLQADGVEVRITKGNPEWTRLAKQAGVKMPFIVDGEQVKPL